MPIGIRQASRRRSRTFGHNHRTPAGFFLPSLLFSSRRENRPDVDGNVRKGGVDRLPLVVAEQAAVVVDGGARQLHARALYCTARGRLLSSKLTVKRDHRVLELPRALPIRR